MVERYSKGGGGGEKKKKRSSYDCCENALRKAVSRLGVWPNASSWPWQDAGVREADKCSSSSSLEATDNNGRAPWA